MLDFRIKPSTAAPARPPAASKHQCVALYPKLKGALVKLRFGASDNPLYLCLVTYLFPGGNVTMSFFFYATPRNTKPSVLGKMCCLLLGHLWQVGFYQHCSLPSVLCALMPIFGTESRKCSITRLTFNILYHVWIKGHGWMQSFPWYCLSPMDAKVTVQKLIHEFDF